jgi:hypothetical protein
MTPNGSGGLEEAWVVIIVLAPEAMSKSRRLDATPSRDPLCPLYVDSGRLRRIGAPMVFWEHRNASSASTISARSNSRTSPTRSGSIRFKSAAPRQRRRRRSAQLRPQIQRGVLGSGGWPGAHGRRRESLQFRLPRSTTSSRPRRAFQAPPSLSYTQDAPPQVVVWTKCDE